MNNKKLGYLSQNLKYPSFHLSIIFFNSTKSDPRYTELLKFSFNQ